MIIHTHLDTYRDTHTPKDTQPPHTHANTEIDADTQMHTRMKEL